MAKLAFNAMRVLAQAGPFNDWPYAVFGPGDLPEAPRHSSNELAY